MIEAEQSSTLSRVEKLIREIVAVDGAIGADTDFVNDLTMDSLDTIDLAMAIEEEFDIELTEDEIEGLDRVGVVVALIEKKVAAQ